MPDVLGMPLEEAVEACKAAGFQTVVSRTSPPFVEPSREAGSRVVRVSLLAPDTVELLAAAAGSPVPRSIPQHIAIICDGNGRWARARGLDRSEGHRAGTENTRRVVEWCRDLGVKYLSLYVFSTENWRRPKSEVEALMNLIVEGAVKADEDLARSGVQLRVLGDVEGLPEVVRKAIDQVTRTTAGNRQIVVNLLLNYGGRADIVRACRLLAAECAAGRLAPDEIDERAVADHMYTAGVPDPDLVIRTAGDARLSNFLLWQSAYSELHFSPVYWPDFSRAHLLLAIDDFSRRGRRFGGLGPEVE